LIYEGSAEEGNILVVLDGASASTKRMRYPVLTFNKERQRQSFKN
jgi:hypothetical protein